MITRTEGHWIISGALVCLDEGQVVSHPSDASVEQFETAEAAMAEHEARYPDQYPTDEGDPA
jgi:zona occludens toxin (predicted ATPase)